MKATRILPWLFSAVLAAAAGQAAAAEHHHDHHAGHPATLQLDQGKKWPTDMPLRTAMSSLREAFAGNLAAIHKGKLGADEYKSLGQKIEAEVGNIVAQCKLEPKADAMLHIVVADLVAGADVMSGKTAGKPAAAAHKAVMALNAYGRYFAHPDWKPLK